MEFPLRFKHLRDCRFFSLSMETFFLKSATFLLHSGPLILKLPFIFILRIPYTRPQVRFCYFLDFIYSLSSQVILFVVGHIPKTSQGRTHGNKNFETLCVWKYLYSILILDWEFDEIENSWLRLIFLQSFEGLPHCFLLQALLTSPIQFLMFLYMTCFILSGNF